MLSYTEDLKWVGGFLPYGRLHFEEKGDPTLADYSADIREMLDEHLAVTGIKTVCKLRRLTDPDFFVDFGKAKEGDEQDQKTAAVRKTAELKKEIADRVADNTPRYEKFSQRLMEIIHKFDEGLLTVAEKVEEMERLAREVQAEDEAHRSSGLSKEAFGVLRILEAHRADGVAVENLNETARQIADLYESDATAPAGWTRKSQLRKELRQQVRRLVFQLGLEDWKEIPAEVDKYAGKHYVKV